MLVKLISQAGTGFFYVMKKNPTKVRSPSVTKRSQLPPSAPTPFHILRLCTHTIPSLSLLI